ncbi:MAG: hypothetical protein JW955_09910 [Sedimentisphaerales bacterium]|nr:hypothetical protein [Sedimentisphaerales bacterium]
MDDLVVDCVVVDVTDTVTILIAKGSITITGLTGVLVIACGDAAYTTGLVAASRMHSTAATSTAFLRPANCALSLLFKVESPPCPPRYSESPVNTRHRLLPMLHCALHSPTIHSLRPEQASTAIPADTRRSNHTAVVVGQCSEYIAASTAHSQVRNHAVGKNVDATEIKDQTSKIRGYREAIPQF